MTLQQAPKIHPVETAAPGAPALDLDFRGADETKPRPGRGRWRGATVALVALAGAGAAYWYFGTGTESAAIALTAPVTRGDVIDTVSALGNLQPREYVDIGAQVSGQLKSIHVEVGQEVKSGDLMAEIDPVVLNAKVEAGRASLASMRAQLIDKEAQRDLANQTLERQRRLVATRAVSETTFETAEATARSAGAQVEMLKAQIQQTDSTLRGDEATLGYTKIYAPMTGTVVSLNAREGQTLNTNQSAPILLRIADLSTMTVWTQVSEADISRLKLGMKAEFTTLGSDGRKWGGTLRQILPTPEIQNNVVLYTALFDVENPANELLTQMTAQVFFLVAEAGGVLTVPITALHEMRRPGSARYTVDVKTGSSVERRPVEVGVKTRVSAEIRSGLKEGDEVVVGQRVAGSGGAAGGQRRGPGSTLRLP
jgi:macrolide-specific efflux system membrane fusion protein